MKKIGFIALVAAALAAGCGGGGRGEEIIDCTPGTTVTVACGSLMLGACTGDPILTVCDGATVPPGMCESSNSLQRNDDREGLCPGLTVECPASGELSVRPTAFPGRTFTCDWESIEGT